MFARTSSQAGRQRRKGAALAAGILLSLAASACTSRAGHDAVAAAVPPAPASSLQAAALPPGLLPGHVGLDAHARVWHVRAALNVAALSCPERSALVERYNALLADKKEVLARAYTAEVDRFRKAHGGAWQPALDSYTTKLYNRFAWPPARASFCPVAAAVATEALTTPPSAFVQFAHSALVRIDRAFVEPRSDGIAVVEPAAPVTSGLGWRIQLGAFTGQSAAEAAWARIRARLPRLAGYVPYYETVPARRELVRLQLAGGADQASALTLCAIAAAGGFDCLPRGEVGRHE